MKWFWIILALLVIATGALFARRGTDRTPTLSPESIATTEPIAMSVDQAVRRSAPAEPAPVVEAPPPEAATESASEAPPPATASAEPAADSFEKAPSEAITKAEPKQEEAAPAVSDSVAPQAPPIDQASITEDQLPALFKDQFEIVPARAKPGDAGVTIYDERFPVKGAGTPEDPMEVTWELLVSASETFQPRMGKKRLPERITMLDGKRVRVTGYVAFPIMAAAQNEMLSMRNMWDGCCIGVPPTPYDALEVKLKEAATGRDRFTAFGTVEGTLKVDPYIKGNWLLGLYLMEDATLSQLKEGGDPGKHGGM
ncbi:MAG: DUF3299 domain-containing protein [Phycisphaerae bacterium]|nr:DUF3299 domain-containing protein [Phycisphaerae bacterium]